MEMAQKAVLHIDPKSEVLLHRLKQYIHTNIYMQ